MSRAIGVWPVTTDYRNNVRNPPPGRFDCSSLKKQPGRLLRGRGVLWEKTLGLFAPLGDTKTQEKAHSPHTLSNSTAAGVGHVAIQQHRQDTQHRKKNRRAFKLLRKLGPSWCSGINEEGHTGTRSRAYSSACCAGGTAQTTLWKIAFRVLTWSVQWGQRGGTPTRQRRS